VQTSCAAHAWPQLPQLAAEVWRSTHAPEHSVSVPGQAPPLDVLVVDVTAALPLVAVVLLA
jgi:hypothetical protein